MIYNSLDTLPIKIFYKIHETGDLTLLKKSGNKDCDYEKLFNQLCDEFRILSDGDHLDKDFFIRREISHQEAVKKVCTLGVEILKHRYIDEIKLQVTELLRIPIRTDIQAHYNKDLERCEKKIVLLDKEIARLSERLTKPDQKDIGKKSSIDDTLASMSSILGIPLNFNKITCTTYLAYKKQAEAKIKSQEQQTNQLKSM